MSVRLKERHLLGVFQATKEQERFVEGLLRERAERVMQDIMSSEASARSGKNAIKISQWLVGVVRTNIRLEEA